MAKHLDFDTHSRPVPIPENLSLLSSDEALCAGIRVTRAQFARMMGVSRQAVTDWVRAGRLTVGADGRLDPAKAVASLLRTGDPARLRAKVLQPMADELTAYRSRITDLEAGLGAALRRIEGLKNELSAAEEDSEFSDASAAGYLAIFEALTEQLPAAWPGLCAQPENIGVDIIIGWLDSAIERGAAEAGQIQAHLAGCDKEMQDAELDFQFDQGGVDVIGGRWIEAGEGEDE